MGKAAGKLRTGYILDPYARMIHLKRAFKLLKELQKIPLEVGQKAEVLVLGSRDKRMREWVDQLKHASGLAFTNPESINAAGISSAPYKYQMILCCDPLMYARYLDGINLPVMAVATAEEVAENPEILDAVDYLLPYPTNEAEEYMHREAQAEMTR